MIDFCLIADLIPPQGSIAFTVTPGRGGRLIVLVQPIYPKVEGLSGKEETAYKQARSPLVLEGSPEELNANFRDILTETRTQEERLHQAFQKKEQAIQNAIETKEKKDPKAGKKEPASPAQKGEATDLPSDGDKGLQLFG